MTDAERAAIVMVVVAVGLMGGRYLFGVWRLGEPWRKHLRTLILSIGFSLVLAAALLLGPSAVGLFGLPALLVIFGVIGLRQGQLPRTVGWLAVAAGVGGLLLSLLRISLFGTR